MSTQAGVPNISAAPPAAPMAAPAPVAAPVVSSPVAASTPAPTVAPVGTAPDPKNFSGDQFAEFRAAKAKYESENPAAPEAVAAVAAVAPAPDAAKVEEPAKLEAAAEVAEAPAEAPTIEEEPTYTPQAITELANRKPALKALLDADPELKGMMYSQARQIAALKPLGELFPDVGTAEFAAKTSTEYVSLRAKFQTAATPEDIDGAMNAFVDQFAIVDDQGTPVLENGQPKLGDDYFSFCQSFKERLFAGAVSEIDERLTANQYASPEAREADENLKLAYDFIQEAKDPSSAGPDLSGLSPQLREQFEHRSADLQAREDALNGKQKSQSKEQTAATNAAYYKDYTKELGSRVRGTFDATIKPLREAGVNVPSYLLDSPDGKTVPQFVSRVLGQFHEVTGKTAKVLQDRVALEQLPKTPENMKRRVEYEDKLYQSYLPKLIKAELRAVSVKVKADMELANKPPASANVSKEPNAAGAAPAPSSWTLESSISEARRLVDAELSSKGEYKDTAERNLLVMTKARQLRGQK